MSNLHVTGNLEIDGTLIRGGKEVANKDGSNITKDSFRENLGIGDWVSRGDDLGVASTNGSWQTFDLVSKIGLNASYTYEVVLEFFCRNQTSADTNSYMRAYTDILVNSMSIITATSQSSRTSHYSNVVTLPLHRYLYVKLEALDAASVYVRGYKRVK